MDKKLYRSNKDSKIFIVKKKEISQLKSLHFFII